MLSFVQIEQFELKKGKKYKIIEKVNDKISILFFGIYNGQYNYDNEYKYNNEKDYLSWKKIYFRSIAIDENYREKPTNDYIEIMKMGIIPLFGRKFYKLVMSKEKIQCAMESRAVNTILQNIIGDKSFIY